MDTPQHKVTVGEWSLAVSEFPAQGEPRGVVVASHAMMCNRRTLDRPRGNGLASTLAAAGLHVYTFDFRGHGESKPGAAGGGRWCYDDIVNEDIGAVVRWAHARHPELRLGFLGHSLAGHAGLHWLGMTADAPVDAVVLYAVNLWIPRLETQRFRWLRKRATLALWKLVSTPVGYFPTRRLRMGTDDESLALVRDFSRWADSDGCRRIADDFDYLAGRANVKAPVLAFVGEHDRVMCAEECAKRYLEPVPQHTVEVVPGASHISLVTQEHSRPAWDRTATWLIEQLGAPRPVRA